MINSTFQNAQSKGKNLLRNVLDDLLQRFATFTAGQDRIIDQNMTSKMDELTVHVEASTNAAFQKLEKPKKSFKISLKN